jgi:hypothetical protein
MPFPEGCAVTDAGAKLQAVPTDGTDCKPITRRLRQRGSGIGAEEGLTASQVAKLPSCQVAKLPRVEVFGFWFLVFGFWGFGPEVGGLYLSSLCSLRSLWFKSF